MSDFKYVGSELELFARLENWKRYRSSQIRRFLKGDVLEVGAGIGANTFLLNPGTHSRWVCLEPDPELTAQLRKNLTAQATPRSYEVVCGTLDSLAGQTFDTILYIDVLEHIENDMAEIQKAVACLRPAGHLIVSSPAHQFLFSPFDDAIGHFRRYTRTTLLAAAPSTLKIQRIRYIDCVGILPLACNKLFLKQSMPTGNQLAFWDRLLIPLSRMLDAPFGYNLGKTIIGVWKNE